MDIGQWMDEMNVCIKCKFPGVEVRILQSSSSLSGFSVVMKMPQTSISSGSYGFDHDEYEMLEAEDSFGSAPATPGTRSIIWPSCMARTVSRAMYGSRWLFTLPYRVYFRMERHRSHATGFLMAAGMMYRTYYAVQCIILGSSRAADIG